MPKIGEVVANPREVAKALRESGLSYSAISRRLKKPLPTVYRWLNLDAHRRYCEHEKQFRKDPKRRTVSRLSSIKGCAKSKGYASCITTAAEIDEAKTGFCFICKQKEEDCGSSGLHIDHCHSSGKFRGWLCKSCNALLGMAKDDISILQNAIEYLEKN